MMSSLGMGVGVFGLVLMVLFWAGLIALAIWLIRALFPPVGQPPAPLTGRDLNAREILDRRFARGEISREEYDLMREAIRNEVA
jgi:uncharacterized membrane protein